MGELVAKIKDLLTRKTVKNGMWLYLLQMFNTVIPLFTLPYITRILGASEYGVFSIAMNIIGYYQVIVEYGFGMSATREVALCNKQTGRISGIFTSVLLARMVLVVLCLAFSGVYCLLYRADPVQCLCLLILSFSMVGYCLQQDWLFQGMQDMKYISVANMVARTLSVALIFLFVRSKEDLLLYCLLHSISPVASGIVGVFLAVSRYKIRLLKIRWEQVWQELKSGWYVFTTQLSSKVFGAIGITVLGVLAAESEVGIYSAIQKIPNTMMLAWAPIAQVLYPVSSEKLQESYAAGKQFVYRMRRVFLPLFILMALGISVFSKWIVGIAFGEEYVQFYYWVIPLLAWLVVAINNNFLGIQILLGGGYDKEYSKCFQLGVICTVVFNIVLIWLFSGTGAAIAPLLSEVALGIALQLKIKALDKKHL